MGDASTAAAAAAAGATPAANSLSRLLREMMRLGNLACFRYFRTELRCREELLVFVHRPEAPPTTTTFGFNVDSLRFATESSGRSTPPPLQQRASAGSVVPFSPLASHVAPASPAAREKRRARPDETLYLVAAYQKYRCPYVWLRDATNAQSDVPVRLYTAQQWKEPDIRVTLWDIVEELVLRQHSSPTRSREPLAAIDTSDLDADVSAFEVDRAALLALPTWQACITSAALAAFLRDLYVSGHDEVHDDLVFLANFHLQVLSGVMHQAQSSDAPASSSAAPQPRARVPHPPLPAARALQRSSGDAPSRSGASSPSHPPDAPQTPALHFSSISSMSLS